MPSGPKIPTTPEQRAAPSLLDPTVQFARQRVKQKAQQATGRGATMLSAPVSNLGKPMFAQGSY